MVRHIEPKVNMNIAHKDTLEADNLMLDSRYAVNQLPIPIVGGKERRMMREIDGKELFSIDDRGFNIKAWYLKDTETEQGDALIRITRKDGLFKEAVYPAYKIYNIAAHSDDIITSEINGDQRGYLIAGSTGLGGYIMPKPIAKAEGAK